MGTKAKKPARRVKTTLKLRLRACYYDNLDLAGVYERSGNTRGSMQLRAVANLLWAIHDGAEDGTVCPKNGVPLITCGVCSKSYTGVDRAKEDKDGKTINMCPMCKAKAWKK